MRFFNLLLICSLLLFSSCTTTKLKNNIIRRATLVENIEIKQKKIESRQKAIISSAIFAIKKAPAAPENIYAVEILTKLHNTLEGSEFLDTNKILHGDKEEKIKLENTIKLIKDEKVSVIKIKEEVKKLDVKITEQINEVDKSSRRNVFWASVGWVGGSFGLVGIVLLCIFLPTFLPLLVSFIKGIINIIISLVKK